MYKWIHLSGYGGHGGYLYRTLFLIILYRLFIHEYIYYTWYICTYTYIHIYRWIYSMHNCIPNQTYIYIELMRFLSLKPHFVWFPSCLPAQALRIVGISAPSMRSTATTATVPGQRGHWKTGYGATKGIQWFTRQGWWNHMKYLATFRLFS